MRTRHYSLSLLAHPYLTLPLGFLCLLAAAARVWQYALLMGRPWLCLVSGTVLSGYAGGATTVVYPVRQGRF